MQFTNKSGILPYCMSLYEVVILIKNSLGEKEVQEVAGKYKTMAQKHKGKVAKEEDWGLRNLAYPIQKSSKARYLFLCLEAPSQAMDEITRDMRINEDVLRHLVIRVDSFSKEPSPVMQRAESG